MCVPTEVMINRNQNELDYLLPWVKSYSTPALSTERQFQLKCMFTYCLPLITVIVHSHREKKVNTLGSSMKRIKHFYKRWHVSVRAIITSWVKPCALRLLGKAAGDRSNSEPGFTNHAQAARPCTGCVKVHDKDQHPDLGE